MPDQQNPETVPVTNEPIPPVQPAAPGDLTTTQFKTGGRAEWYNINKGAKVGSDLRPLWEGEGPAPEPISKWQTRGTTGYWQDLARVARYQIALDKKKPEDTPPSVDMRNVQIAYDYYRFMNNDKPYYQWDPKAIPDDDPMYNFIGQMQAPDKRLMHPGEYKYLPEEQNVGKLLDPLQRDLDIPMEQVVMDLFKQGLTVEIVSDWITTGEVPIQHLDAFKEAGYDAEDRAWWQQLITSALTKPGRMGATIGAMTGGGAPGMAVGYALGTAAGKNEKVANLLLVLDYFWQGLERTVTASLMAGSIVGKAVKENPDNWFRAGADASADVVNHLKELWQASQFGAEALKLPGQPEKTHKFDEDWREGSKWGSDAQLGMDSLLVIRDELINGASMEETYEKWMYNFGVEGLTKEIIGGIFLDPLNWLFPQMALTEVGQNIAKAIGGDQMVAAVKFEKGRPINVVKKYGDYLRTNYAPSGVAKTVSEFSAIDRVLTGIAIEGHWLDDTRLKLSDMDTGNQMRHAVDELSSIDDAARAALDQRERIVDIYEKVENGTALKDQEVQAMGNEIAGRVVADPNVKLTDAEIQYITNHGAEYERILMSRQGEAAVYPLATIEVSTEQYNAWKSAAEITARAAEAKTPQEYIDVRMSSKGEPTRFGKVAGAITAGGLAGALGSSLFGPIGLGLGALVMGNIGFKKGLSQLLTLTPEARAAKLANSVGINIKMLLEEFKSMDDVDLAVELSVKRIRGIINTPTEVAEALSIGILKSPEGKILPKVLAGMEEKLGAHMIAWEKGKWANEVKNTMAKMLGMDPEDVLKGLDNKQGATQLLARFQEQLRKVEDPGAKDLLAAIEEGILTPDNLVNMSKLFTEKGLATSMPQWIEQLVEMVGIHSGNFAVDWFGVKPDVFTNRFFNTIKSVNSLFLLGLNPMYAVNNAIGDAVAAIAEGVFGLQGREKALAYWKRFGIEPPSMHMGEGAAGEHVFMTGTGAEQIRAATRVEDGLSKFQNTVRSVQNKIGFASKLAATSEKFGSMNVLTAAMKQFWGRTWRPGIGFDDVPTHLVDALDAIDPSLVKQLRDVITMGMNAKEISTGLQQGITRLGIDHWLPEIAPSFGKTAQDAAGLLHHFGAYDFLTERLNLAETNADVRTAFTDLYDHIDNEIFKYMEEFSETKRNMIKQEITVEGAQAAIIRMNREIFIDESVQRINDFADWGRVFDMREKVKTGEISQSNFVEAVKRQRKQSEIRYKRAFSRWRNEMLGITEGLGLNNTHSRRLIAEMVGIERTWTEFYTNKHKKLDRFFKTFYENYDQSSAAWKALQEDLSRDYSRTLSEESLFKINQDRVFVDMMGKKYGENVRKVTEGVFDEVAKLRDEMGIEMRNFIDSLNRGDIPLSQKDLMWSEFREKTVVPMWVEKMNSALKGMDEVYEAINEKLFGSGEDPAGRPPTDPGDVDPGAGGLKPEPGEPGAGGIKPVDDPVPAEPVQREIFGKEPVEGEPVETPSTTPGAARKAASEFGYATADAEGNYLPGADVHLLNIVKAYHPDSTRVSRYNSLNDIVNPAAEVKLAFEERTKIKDAIANNQKRAAEAQIELNLQKVEIEKARAADAVKLEDMTDAEIRKTYDITDDEVANPAPMFGTEDVDARDLAVIELFNRNRKLERTQVEYRDPANMQRFHDAGLAWEGMEKLSDPDYLGFDSYPETLEMQLQSTAAYLLDAAKNRGRMSPVDQIYTEGGLPVDVARLDVDPTKTKFEQRRVRAWSDPAWKPFREAHPEIAYKTVENVLQRLAKGDYQGKANKSETAVASYVIDMMMGGAVENPEILSPLMMRRGNPGVLYIQGLEARAARALQYHFLERIKDDTWDISGIEELAGTSEIFDHLYRMYEDLPDNQKLPEHQELLDMKLVDDTPTPDAIRIEQSDLLEQTQQHQMDQVKQQEQLINQIEEYRHLADNPRSQETNLIREAFIRDQQRFQDLSPEQADALAQAWDARARIWSGETGRPQQEFWDEIYGMTKGMDPVDDVLYDPNFQSSRKLDVGKLTELRKQHQEYGHVYRGDWEQAARDVYPLTENPGDAGYILDNGDMLDFSEGGGMGRVQDHRNVMQIFDDIDQADIDAAGLDYVYADDHTGGGAMLAFMGGTSAVRMHIGSGELFIDFSNPLSTGQWRRIREITEVYQLDIIYDINTRNGNQVTSGLIEAPRDYEIGALKDHVNEVFSTWQDPEFVEKPGMFHQMGDKTNPIWYSKLENWTNDLPMDTMQVEQFQGMLKKAGITKDELYWTGIQDYADGLKPGEMISKTEIQDYVKRNKVEITETVLRKNANTSSKRVAARHAANTERIRWIDELKRADDARKRIVAEISARIPEDVMQVKDSEGFVVKESTTWAAVERTLQGGASTQGIEQHILRADYDLYNQYNSSANDATARIHALDSEIATYQPGGDARYMQYTLGSGSGAIDYKEFLLKFNSDMPGRGHMDLDAFTEYWKDYATRAGLDPHWTTDEQVSVSYTNYLQFRNEQSNLPYTHGHWRGGAVDQFENIVAHGRATTRLTEAGELAYNIEEIQSDLHQAARTEQYRRRVTDVDAREQIRLYQEENIARNTADKINKELFNYLDHMKFEELGISDWEAIRIAIREGRIAVDQKDITTLVDLEKHPDPEVRRLWDLHETYRNEVEVLLQERDALRTNPPYGSAMRSSSPPEAPWSKSWDELVAKRLIRDAVEAEADVITWTTGKQQADRYPLEYRWDQIDTHDINLIGNDSRMESGYSAIDDIITDLKLDGVIGNEAVILKEFMYLFPDAHMGDLHAGNVVNQRTLVFNKADLNLKLDGNDSWVKTVEAEMKNNPTDGNVNVIQPGMEAFYDNILPWSMEKISKDWNTKIETERVAVGTVGDATERLRLGADQSIRILEETGMKLDQVGYEEVHSMRITQEMKESVMSGQQLLQNNGRPKAAIEFMKDGKALFRALESPDFSSMVHESFHFFRRGLTDADQSIWNSWSRVEQQGSRTWKAINSEMEIKKTKAGYEFDGQKFETLDEATRVLQEEMFARGGEKYFAEGIAPAPQLTKIFQQFKTWMMEVYRIISGSDIDVNITPEMKRLFDRMFAEEAANAFEGQANMFAGSVEDLPMFSGTAQKGTLSTFDPKSVAKTEIMPGFEDAYKPQMKGMGNADLDITIAQKMQQIKDLGTGAGSIDQARTIQAEIDALTGMRDPDSGALFQNAPQRFTPEFEAWFRGAHESVKNPDGTPRKLYHFTEDGSWLGDPGAQFMATVDNPMGIIYMSDQPGFVYDAKFGKPGATIVELYSNLKNPWMADEGMVAGLNPKNFKPEDKAGPRMIEILKAQGYDGAINVKDHEWVAFYPEGVKSTINRNPTNDPRILNQMGEWNPTDNGNARLLPQVTPESEANFRRWFRASQVVDEAGQPMRVYHGTNQEFRSLDPETRGMMTEAESAKEGFWFTSEPEEAGTYAQSAAGRLQPDDIKWETIDKEFAQRYDDLVGTGDWKAIEEITRQWEEHNQTLQNPPEGQMIYPMYLKIENPKVIQVEKWRLLDLTNEIQQAKEAGHDGVIFKDILDAHVAPTDNYVIFEPGQAKSIFNRGTWDPDSTDLYYQKGDGSVEQMRNSGEMPEPVGMASGTYQQAAQSQPPLQDMSRQTYDELVYPMLQRLEESMLGEGAQVTNKIGDAELPPEVAIEMTKYLDTVKGQMAETKNVGVRHAEGMRSAALLNYNDRVGFDPITEAFMPYQFYYTRAGLAYARRFINRPGLLSNYARIRNDERKGGTAQPGFPQRLMGKTKIPLPFLPKWAQGSVYVDPLHNLFQFEQLPPFNVLNKRAEDLEMMQRQTGYVIEGMFDNGEITIEQAQQAMSEQTGAVWDNAYSQAKARVMGDSSNPMDFIELLTGYSLPLQMMSAAMKGEKGDQGMLPFSRLVRAATAWQVPGGVNLEKQIRKAIGFPEQDRWNGIYYPIRELGNMVLDEGLDYQEAQRAMIEQEGEVWLAAVDRAGKYQALKFFGSVLWADFFPEGEEKQRALQTEFSKAMRSKDPEAVSTFFDAYPEYQARMQVFNWDDPEQMMRQYMKSQIWNGYYNKSDQGRRKLRDALGEDFNINFLNGETRNYELITTDTLVRWAQMVGGKMPSTIEVREQPALDPKDEARFQQFDTDRSTMWGSTSELISGLWRTYWNLPEDQRDAFKDRFPQMQQMDDWETMYLAEHPQLISDVGPEKVRDAPLAVQGAYMDYNSERIRRFGSDIYDIQAGFFDQETDADRDTYLQRNPELQAYWKFRRDVLEDFPTLAPYIDSVERIGRQSIMPQIPPVNITKFDDALLRAMLGYYTYGKVMGTGAYKILRKEWKQGGYEEEFDDWLDGALKESFEYFLASP